MESDESSALQWANHGQLLEALVHNLAGQFWSQDDVLAARLVCRAWSRIFRLPCFRVSEDLFGNGLAPDTQQLLLASQSISATSFTNDSIARLANLLSDAAAQTTALELSILHLIESGAGIASWLLGPKSRLHRVSLSSDLRPHTSALSLLFQEIHLNTSITTLDLNNCRLGDAGLAIVLAALSRGNSSVTSLNLSRCLASGASEQAVSELLLSTRSIKSLTLDGDMLYMEREQSERLGAAIRMNSSLTTLSLLGTSVPHPDAIVGGAAANPRITKLKISSPWASVVSLRAMYGALGQNRTLTSLTLSIGAPEPMPLSEACHVFRIPSLRRLRLGAKSINIGTDVFFGELRTHTRLESLSLTTDCRLDLDGELAKYMAQDRLRSLSLTRNELSKLGPIVKALRGCTRLRKLEIELEITSGFAEYIRTNTTLIELTVRAFYGPTNPILELLFALAENMTLSSVVLSRLSSKDGRIVRALCDLLRNNATLQRLRLEFVETKITDESIKTKFANALATNTALMQLDCALLDSPYRGTPPSKR